MQANDELLTPVQAAQFLGISDSTMATWRSQKKYDLVFVRVGYRIKYRKSDLIAFLERRTFRTVAKAA